MTEKFPKRRGLRAPVPHMGDEGSQCFALRRRGETFGQPVQRLPRPLQVAVCQGARLFVEAARPDCRHNGVDGFVCKRAFMERAGEHGLFFRGERGMVKEKRRRELAFAHVPSGFPVRSEGAKSSASSTI